MTIHNLLAEYHDWMLDKMQANLPEHRNHSLLLSQLDNTSFVVVNPYDENRELDAHFLRQQFLREENIDERCIWGERASVLEVLVAMSIRIETEITGEVDNDHLERWFWVILENLGLNMYDDDRYDRAKINGILDIWMSRKYKKDGKNGAFPLRKTSLDQREIDLWYQMQLYLTENWHF